MRLDRLETPCLLLDRMKMRRNLARMADRIGGMGCNLRPHVKTHKSVDVMAEVVGAGHVRGITVSTLAEAEHFFDAGYADILYAVGIAVPKLDRVAALMDRGCDVKIVLDSVAMALAVAARGEVLVAAGGRGFSVLIEIDVDGHRAGVRPEALLLLEIGAVLAGSAGCRLAGVMTHAGDSYGCTSAEALRAMAAQERDLCLAAASRLREAGHDCAVVSIGSTPTALNVEHLEGITEVRVGVYTFFDLVQAGLGVCAVDDIAVSVLATVIGVQAETGRVIADAGWMALSRDLGTADQAVDQGYGLVCAADGTVSGDVVVSGANQEHGILSRRDRGRDGGFRGGEGCSFLRAWEAGMRQLLMGALIIGGLGADVLGGAAGAQGVVCDTAMPQVDLNACAAQAQGAADAALLRHYQAVMARLSPDGQRALRRAQEAWARFRDRQCQFEAGGADGGSIAPMIYSECLRDLSLARAEVLAGFRDCAEGDLRCPR